MIKNKGGNKTQYLADNTGKFIQEAMKRPEIGTIFTTFQADVPQKFLDINRDKVLKAGISLNDMYTTVGAFLGGSYVNDFNRFGRLYKAYIQAELEYRLNQRQPGLFFIKNKNGVSVPLSAFINVEDIVGPEFTNRFNLFRSVELTGAPAEGYTSNEALTALEEVAAEILPSNMSYAWSNMSYQEKAASGSGNIVFLFALIFVFLILASQYESWTLPFSIGNHFPYDAFNA